MPQKIKVFHIVTLLELGGAQQNTLSTLSGLDRRRFEPMLLCGRGAYLDSAAREGNYPVRFVSSLDRPIRPWWDLLALAKIYLILRKEKPDIVHTHSSKAGILGRLAAILAQVPVIVHTYHGFGFTRAQWPVVRWFFVGLERFLAPRTTVLIVVSQANREEALSRGIGRPSQFRLIRSGVVLSDFRGLVHRVEPPADFPLFPSDQVITTIGPFKPQKNLLDFVRAAQIVAERRPEARFLIIGDGRDRMRIERQIKKRNLTDRFFLAGWRRDIPAILARTDIFCLTSLWEGLPRALVEAMAAGIPCVANAVDGCIDLIQDGVNGFLIAPGHPRATADRLLRLLEDSPMAQRMGARARLAIGPEFEISNMVQEQERLYTALSFPRATGSRSFG